MPPIGLGIQLWAQATDWSAYQTTAQRVDDLGYDELWTWDHLLSAVGDPGQPVFEGYATLAAWAATTRRARLGLLVGANTFRNPAMVAKSIATIDHISGGRAILGLGGGWHEREHQAYGVDFGRGFGDRLEWLDEALGVIRPLLDGHVVTHDGPRYRTDRLALAPRPVQPHIPIMVGGVGERKTLLSVARYADMWNAAVSLEDARHKLEVLQRHCDAVGRDIRSIQPTVNCKVIIRDDADDARSVLESQLAHNSTDAQTTVDHTFWVGTPVQVADRMRSFCELGFQGFTIELLAPFDEETLERLITDVRPLVEQE